MQWINFHQSINQRLNYEEPDEEQIKVKNFKIEGHSVVRGVAGSGKSLAVMNRVEKIISEKHYESILVLCYNRFMQNWLQYKLKEKGLSSKVECKTFHKWSYQRIGYSYKYDHDLSLRKELIVNAKKSGLKYQAILIDESQDFYDEWFQAVLEVLDPQTNSFFFVYDNAQSVYIRPDRMKSDWNLKNLGVTIAGGSSQVLDINYRNSPEILELAWKFMKPVLKEAGITPNRNNRGGIAEPQKKASRSSGISPTILQINYQQMPVEIAKQVKMALSTCPDSSIGILTHPEKKALRAEISRELEELGVEHDAPRYSEERGRNVVDRPYVIVDSWNALKGVEFDAVIIAGVDLADDFEEKAGLYVAMTRARDHLIILYDYRNFVIDECLKSPDHPLSSVS